MVKLTTYHHKDLLQSSNCPHVPRSFEIHTIGVTMYQMFRQDHNKPLKRIFYNSNKRTINLVVIKLRGFRLYLVFDANQN